MTEPEQRPLEIFVCTWCKDQIKADEVKNHAKTCALIPDEERARLANTGDPAVEKIEVKSSD